MPSRYIPFLTKLDSNEAGTSGGGFSPLGSGLHGTQQTELLHIPERMIHVASTSQLSD